VESIVGMCYRLNKYYWLSNTSRVTILSSFLLSYRHVFNKTGLNLVDYKIGI